jgi:hypothetical protein
LQRWVRASRSTRTRRGKGAVKDDDLAKAFLSIWLGADPPNPEIKGGLLGGSRR